MCSNGSGVARMMWHLARCDQRTPAHAAGGGGGWRVMPFCCGGRRWAAGRAAGLALGASMLGLLPLCGIVAPTISSLAQTVTITAITQAFPDNYN